MENGLHSACEPHKHLTIIDKILNIPQQIINGHHSHGLIDLLLYDLAGTNGLGFNKAAYLVDNPDFNTLKGISGYTQAESFNPEQDLLAQLQQANYNCKVKQFCRPSLRAANQPEAATQAAIQSLAQELELNNPKFHTWNLKHNNYGLFLFEPSATACCNWQDGLVQKIVNFFGLCSI